MKRKSVLILGFVGVLALSIGFMKDLQGTKVFAQNEQPRVEDGQTDTNSRDQYKVITREEQEIRESMLAEGKEVSTVITAKEQEIVENMSAQQGFIPQANGTGFYFEKEKK